MRYVVFLGFITYGCMSADALDGLQGNEGGSSVASSGAGGSDSGSSASGAGGTTASSVSASNAASTGSGEQGSGGSGGGGSGGGTAAPCVDPAACDDCLKTACVGEFSACSGSDCVNILACVYGCPCADDACWNGCYAQFAPGQADYDALASCALAGNCGTCAPQP